MRWADSWQGFGRSQFPAHHRRQRHQLVGRHTVLVLRPFDEVSTPANTLGSVPVHPARRCTGLARSPIETWGDRMAVKEQACSTERCSRTAAYTTRTKPSWCTECMAEMLATMGLAPLAEFPATPMGTGSPGARHATPNATTGGNTCWNCETATNPPAGAATGSSSRPVRLDRPDGRGQAAPPLGCQRFRPRRRARGVAERQPARHHPLPSLRPPGDQAPGRHRMGVPVPSQQQALPSPDAIATALELDD